MASNLRARTSNFAVSFLVTNLLAMAPQPAFNGLQPKSDHLQLTCFVLLRPLFYLGCRVANRLRVSTHNLKCVFQNTWQLWAARFCW